MNTPLEKYLGLRVTNIFNHLHDFELNGDEVSMHDLRVEIKKMKAIITFLRNVYHKQKLKKDTNILRAIFHDAGEIREYQLMLKWLEKKEFTLIVLVHYPPAALKELIEKFQHNIPGLKSSLDKIAGEVSDIVHDTNIIHAEQYFTELNARVLKRCHKYLPQNEWHELRKLIKRRLYAYNWINHETDNDDPNFSYFNKLQEAIGQWHDLLIIKESLLAKEIYLSQDIEVQKDFNLAWEKLKSSIKYRERIIERLLSKKNSPD